MRAIPLQKLAKRSENTYVAGSGEVGSFLLLYVLPTCTTVAVLPFFFFPLDLDYEYFYRGLGLLTSCIILSSMALQF